MPFDFAAVTAPFRMQPGLRRLAAGAAQLTPSRVGDAAFTEKLATLRWHHEEALLAAPGFDAGPGLRALIEHAAREQPDALIWDGDGALTAPHLGWSLRGDEVCPAEVHSNGPADIGHALAALPVKWRAAGLLSLAFAEDFALLDGTTACIPWLAVCLPSHWAPQDKVGRHFVEVHAPVADSQLLLTAADHLARLVTGAERWERFVWTLTGEPHLRMHPRHLEHRDWPGERCGTELAAHTFFRTERQTFIPIPGLQQAVFTIHVETRPLTQALATPAQARQLHDALASMSPAVLAYRGLSAAQPRLLAWLADQFGAPLP